MQIMYATPFLLSGCVAFLICAFIPQIRRFALSASLWCVACGPCLAAVFIALVLVEKGANTIHGGMLHSLFSIEGKLALACMALVAMAGAAVITLVHGWIVRRLTLNLFRLYLTGVTVGVGLLIALATGILLLINFTRLQSSTAFVYTVLLLVIPSSLAFFAYRNAAGFRGKRPEFLNPISADECS
jgi:hypothetical protein